VTKQLQADRPGSWKIVKERWKQAKPYNLPLQYLIRDTSTSSGELFGESTSYLGYANSALEASTWQMHANQLVFESQLASEVDQALNNARSRFSSKLSESAEVLVNLAERRQTMEMVSQRAIQLYRFTRELRRFNFHQAARELKLPSAPPGVRKKAHAFANNFLEYHLGWAPLVCDIGNAVNFLSDPIPLVPVHGRGKRVPISSTYFQNLYPPYKEWMKGEAEGWVGAYMGAKVRVNNSNLWLSNRLGLINPGTVALELVPFSFIADWFVNIFDYFGQFTEFSGIDVIDPYYGWRAMLKCRGEYHYIIPGQTTRNGFVVHSEGSYLRRSLGIPNVTFGIRPAWRLSPSRALTAISLLIQQGIRP
jgi:hypothetical protein